MKKPPLLIKVYAFLLRLYPRSYREEFAEEMLLDFTEMVADARQTGSWALALFCLRELIDFPISLLQAHSRENHMTPVFHSGPARGAFQGALALGLAFAAMMSVMDLIITMLTGGGWLFLMRVANSQGWHLKYDETARLILNTFASIVGVLLAGFLLALSFREMHRLKRYLLLGVLGWAAPLALIRIIGSLMGINNASLFNAILHYMWTLLTGLGLGAVFSLIVQNRKKTPWLLLAGFLGYAVIGNSTRWIFLFLRWILPPFHKYMLGPALWSDLVTIAAVYSIIGIVLGAVLGAISGWSGRKTISA